MDSVFSTIRSRRSIRDFKNKPIPRAIISKLLDSFMWAPSAGNIPHRYVVVVQDEKLIKQLASACIDQEWIGEASVVFVVCSDTKSLENIFGKLGKTYSLQGTAAATQNVLLTAKEFGIGSTWVGAYSESKIRKIVRLPPEIDIHNLIALGYPLKVPKAPIKPLLHKIARFDLWSNESEPDLEPVLQSKVKQLGKKIKQSTSRLKSKKKKK